MSTVLTWNAFTLTVIMWLADCVNCLCPSKCVCLEDKLSVNCKDASLDGVPITLNPEIRELFLSHNHIKSISESFSFYGNLQFLDLSGNQLASIGRKHFAAQSGLQVLLLQRNLLTNVDSDSFSGLTSLQLLNLNQNLLAQISDGAFHGLGQLEKLDLSRNVIKTISSATFNGLVNLKSLSLRSNRLTSVPSTALRSLTALVKLDLGGNPILTVEDRSFERSSHLVDLRLDQCWISSMSREFGIGLRSLRRLHLDSNRLATVNREWFTVINGLEDLVLSNNRLTTLYGCTLSPLSSLRKLDLQNNRYLSSIDEEAFSGLTNLTRVNLDSTPNLVSLPEGLFRDCKSSLMELSVRGSGVSTIPYSLFNWDHLRYFDVRNTPLSCNCSNLWMWTYLRRTNFTSKEYSDHLVCALPPQLRGKHFLALSEHHLHCSNASKVALFSVGFGLIILAILACFTVMYWCKHRLRMFWERHEKLSDKLQQDFMSEKRRIIENQLIFPPPSSYHPSSSLVYVHPPVRKTPISQV